MPNKQMLVAAAEKFIDKVERGAIHSKVSYREFKAALEAEEDNAETRLMDRATEL